MQKKPFAILAFLMILSCTTSLRAGIPSFNAEQKNRKLLRASLALAKIPMTMWAHNTDKNGDNSTLAFCAAYGTRLASDLLEFYDHKQEYDYADKSVTALKIIDDLAHLAYHVVQLFPADEKAEATNNQAIATSTDEQLDEELEIEPIIFEPNDTYAYLLPCLEGIFSSIHAYDTIASDYHYDRTNRSINTLALLAELSTRFIGQVYETRDQQTHYLTGGAIIEFGLLAVCYIIIVGQFTEHYKEYFDPNNQNTHEQAYAVKHMIKQRNCQALSEITHALDHLGQDTIKAVLNENVKPWSLLSDALVEHNKARKPQTFDIIKFLLEREAPASVEGEKNPLLLTQDRTVRKLLIEHGVKAENQYDAQQLLILALQSSDTELFQALIGQGALNYIINTKQQSGVYRPLCSGKHNKEAQIAIEWLEQQDQAAPYQWLELAVEHSNHGLVEVMFNICDPSHVGELLSHAILYNASPSIKSFLAEKIINLSDFIHPFAQAISLGHMQDFQILWMQVQKKIDTSSDTTTEKEKQKKVMAYHIFHVLEKQKTSNTKLMLKFYKILSSELTSIDEATLRSQVQQNTVEEIVKRDHSRIQSIYDSIELEELINGDSELNLC
ncbi:MAG: hypothetical protein H6679_01930 [Epsilonproteobacteria bacterium]|nr:hypothetical protein [Campylobacterota bacterium]